MNNSTWIWLANILIWNSYFTFFRDRNPQRTKVKYREDRGLWLWSQFNFGYEPTTSAAHYSTVCPEFQWTFSFWPFAKLQISLPFLHSLVRLSSRSSAVPFIERMQSILAQLSSTASFSLLDSRTATPSMMMMIIINIFAQVFANQSCLANW